MDEKRYRIRTAQPEDAEELLAIYAPYVERSAVSFEYDLPPVEEFRSRICRVLERYPYLVAEKDGEILGYAYADTFHARQAYDWSVEVSIYVREDRRGEGLGRALYAALETVLAEQNIINLYACIASPPEEGDEFLSRDSEAFHRRMGYSLVGEFRRCGYKFGRWYHMIWMEKHIGEPMAAQPPMKPFSSL